MRVNAAQKKPMQYTQSALSLANTIAVVLVTNCFHSLERNDINECRLTRSFLHINYNLKNSMIAGVYTKGKTCRLCLLSAFVERDT